MAVNTINDTEFAGVLAGQGKIAVQFYAEWCGACRLFKPKFRRLSEAPEFEGTQFFMIDAEENPEARKLAGVSNLPFFAVFKNGELVEGFPSSVEESVHGLVSKIQ